MKTIHMSLAVLLFFAFVGCQTNPDQTAPESNTIKEVENALTFLNQAMLDRSEEKLDAICAEQLTYGHSNGNIQTKAQFKDEVLNGPYDYTSILTPDLKIQVIDDTAVARFIFDIKGIKNEESQTVQLGCVQIYKKKAGKWKLLMRQAYKLS